MSQWNVSRAVNALVLVALVTACGVAGVGRSTATVQFADFQPPAAGEVPAAPGATQPRELPAPEEQIARPRVTEQLQPEDYQTWQQAGQDDDALLGSRLRSHRIRLVNGELRGRLLLLHPQTGEQLPVSQMAVYVLANGRSVARAVVDRVGAFLISGLRPGVYGFVASGPDGFAAYTVQLVGDEVPPAHAGEGEPGGLQNVSHLQEEVQFLEMETFVVPPSNFVALRELIQSYVPTSTEAVQLLSPEPVPGAEPPAAPEAEPDTADSSPGTTLRHHAVRLTSDGRLLGRIRRLHPQTGEPLRPGRRTVFLLRNDQISAQVPVRENGVFAVDSFSPGLYSLVSVSREPTARGADTGRQVGFLAFSIQVLPPLDEATAMNDQAARFASLLVLDDGATTEIDAAELDGENSVTARSVFQSTTDGGQAGGGGGGAGGAGGGGGGGATGGGSGGGGGGGSGAGGAGPAAGAAALTAAAIAAGSQSRSESSAAGTVPPTSSTP